jgi:hypothetical protein
MHHGIIDHASLEIFRCNQILTDLGLGCDFFRKYTDTQICIGWCGKVFPSHTDFFFFCVSVLYNRDFFVKQRR